jgi:hypothetical protein
MPARWRVEDFDKRDSKRFPQPCQAAQHAWCHIVSSTTNPATQLAARRRKRIERELSALRTIEGHLFTSEIVWAVLTVPGVAALVILVAWKVHWWSDSPATAAAVAALTGLTVWWIGRRWFWLAAIIVFGLVLILLEDLPDLDIGGGSARERRRIKLERAIARREAMLAQMDGRR